MTLPATSVQTGPPTNPNINLIFEEYECREMDFGGTHLIRKPLLASDKTILQDRLKILRTATAPADKKQAAELVAQMLLGFARRDAAENAQPTTAQYVKSLLGLPLWAIAKACERWERGQVSPDEVGAKKIDRAFPPSTAQLSMTAHRAVDPCYLELVRITKIMGGRVRKADPTPEERERVNAKFKELVRALRENSDRVREIERAEGKKLSAATASALLSASAKLRPDDEEVEIPIT